MHTTEQTELYDILKTYSETELYPHGSRADLSGVGYLALGISPESLPNSNAVSIFADASVSFFTHDAALVGRLKALGFHSDPLTLGQPRNEFGYNFHDLTAARVRLHEPEFRQLVRDSVQIVSERNLPKGHKPSESK